MTREWGVRTSPPRLRPRLPSPLQPVEDERFARHGVRLLLKRDDLIHPDLPGQQVAQARARTCAAAAGPHPVTFGGAYSNHLRATAAAGRLLGLRTVGIVRGDELASRPLTPRWPGARRTACGCTSWTGRRTARKTDPDDAGRRPAAGPDGRGSVRRPRRRQQRPRRPGLHRAGPRARATPPTWSPSPAVPAAPWPGSPPASPPAARIGFPVLRAASSATTIRALQRRRSAAPPGTGPRRALPLRRIRPYHPELDAFAADFEARHGLPVERVYVAKMLYGLTALADEGAFPPGTTVAAVITGQDARVLAVGRRLLQVQPAQQRTHHLVVDPPLVPQLNEDLALGVDHLPRRPGRPPTPGHLVHRPEPSRPSLRRSSTVPAGPPGCGSDPAGRCAGRGVYSGTPGTYAADQPRGRPAAAAPAPASCGPAPRSPHWPRPAPPAAIPPSGSPHVRHRRRRRNLAIMSECPHAAELPRPEPAPLRTLSGMSGGRQSSRATAAVPGLRACGLLRFLAPPARHGALQGDRASGDAELEPGESWRWCFVDGSIV